MSGVLITGGSRGIGAATARLAASRGHDVAITYVARADEAEAVVADCRSHGVVAAPIRADVAVEGDVVAAFETARSELGGIDAVIVNAGVIGPISPLRSMTAERMQRIVDVNVVGALLTAREAVRALDHDQNGRGGTIVFVSSAASRLGSPNEFVDYAATKGAVDTLTIGLAKELGPLGIRVLGIRPGLIDTEIHADAGRPDRVAALAHNVPMQRGGTAEEVAETILWAISDAASYVSGALLDVAGGR